MNKDDRFEAQIAIACQRLLLEYAEEFDETGKNGGKASAELRKRIEKLLDADERRKQLLISLRAVRRVAVYAACILVALAMIGACIRPVREYFLDAVFTWYEDYMDVTYPAMEKTKVEKESRVHKTLGYIPEGYAFEMENEDRMGYTIQYRNENLLLQYQELYVDTNISVNNQDVTATGVIIDETEGILFVYKNDERRINLVWNIDGVVYMITADLSSEEILKVAESIE